MYICDGRMLEGTLLLLCIDCVLALIWKFLTKFGDMNSVFHSDKICADNVDF